MSERATVQGKIGRSATTNPLYERIDPYQSIGCTSRSGAGIGIYIPTVAARSAVGGMPAMASIGAKSRMHSSTTDHDEYSWRVRRIAPFDAALKPASPRRTAGHGNDRVWKAWKAMKPASHPSHTLWKSLRDCHIPTASTTRLCLLEATRLEPEVPQGACNGCLRSTA
jgi:hypothetical protein